MWPCLVAVLKRHSQRLSEGCCLALQPLASELPTKYKVNECLIRHLVSIHIYIWKKKNMEKYIWLCMCRFPYRLLFELQSE